MRGLPTMARAKLMQLSLTNAQVHAALGEGRIVALRQGHDEVVRPHRLGRGDHVRIAGGGTGVADVLLDGPGKQVGLLQDHAHLAHQ